MPEKEAITVINFVLRIFSMGWDKWSVGLLCWQITVCNCWSQNQPIKLSPSCLPSISEVVFIFWTRWVCLINQFKGFWVSFPVNRERFIMLILWVANSSPWWNSELPNVFHDDFMGHRQLVMVILNRDWSEASCKQCARHFSQGSWILRINVGFFNVSSLILIGLSLDCHSFLRFLTLHDLH